MIDCRMLSHTQAHPVWCRSARNTKGSQPRFTLNTRISSSPVKNVGSEKPTKASVFAIWSNTEYGRSAASTPTGTATRIASNCAAPITAMVTGSRCRISRSTSIRLTNENPQSPCSMASSQRK